MIPLFRRLAFALLWDELAFVRWMRGLMLMLAAGGVGFADQLAALVGEAGAPRVILGIKLVSLLCGFLGGAITAGERNPRVPELAPAEPPPAPEGQP